MNHATEMQKQRCPRCGGNMKANGKHSCGASAETSSSKDDGGPLDDRIRARAYELYVSRGREDGHAEEDWARAEKELRDRTRSDKSC